ncbi:Epidermal patterning factor-like protein 6 [Apostasia shenzhenica]|uniref:Epidermal patterning factor-like protein n=1 Tax=Apostasia shenzhenica TaxID=1088818 RepID=A0A2I0AIH0_9ASPA|nr:Epidermal patterning factor-like protein 6 [Apostasia shenzhenica]
MKIFGECLPGPAAAHRGLLGPGSYPPRCTHKCGRCRPCLAVHVPVPPAGTPGIPATDEYYPEAWRWGFREEVILDYQSSSCYDRKLGLREGDCS